MHIFAQNVDDGYTVGSPQPVFWNQNKKNKLCPCKPHFEYIKVGCKDEHDIN